MYKGLLNLEKKGLKKYRSLNGVMEPTDTCVSGEGASVCWEMFSGRIDEVL